MTEPKPPTAEELAEMRAQIEKRRRYTMNKVINAYMTRIDRLLSTITAKDAEIAQLKGLLKDGLDYAYHDQCGETYCTCGYEKWLEKVKEPTDGD